MSAIKVIVPSDLFPSVVIGASGEPYPVKTGSDGMRFLTMSAADAQVLICGGFADGRWKLANQQLGAALGPPPKVEHGVNVAQLQMAQQRRARGPSALELCARRRGLALQGW